MPRIEAKTSKAVFKYELEPTATLQLPTGARVLSAGVQGDHVFIWVAVDTNPKARREQRRFAVLGTGHECPDLDTYSFIGTVFMFDASLVFHVFEIKT